MLMSIGRRMGLLLTTAAATLVVASGVALAAVIVCEPNKYCLGTSADDTITGTDETFSDSFPDQGRTWGDSIWGYEGNDTIKPRKGPDVSTGGLGADTYEFENDWGVDKVVEGADASNVQDYIDFRKLTTAVNIDLVPSDSNGKAIAWSGTNKVITPSLSAYIENAYGGQGNDTLRGTSIANTLKGHSGSDYLYGRSGNDSLQGEDGNDRLTGEEGKDSFYGGAGNDVIDARDKLVDGTISCGVGYDTVYYDQYADVPSSDCELKYPTPLTQLPPRF